VGASVATICASIFDVPVAQLAIHCGPIAGGYGCDMGQLPSPPGALTVVAYALAAPAVILGAYLLLSGRLPLRVGRLKQIHSRRATRLLGASLVIWSFGAALTGWETAILSHQAEPSPRWLGMTPFLALIASLGLSWWAYRLDRRARPLP
jgi:hypothetical protein